MVHRCYGPEMSGVTRLSLHLEFLRCAGPSGETPVSWVQRSMILMSLVQKSEIIQYLSGLLAEFGRSLQSCPEVSRPPSSFRDLGLPTFRKICYPEGEQSQAYAQYFWHLCVYSWQYGDDDDDDDDHEDCDMFRQGCRHDLLNTLLQSLLLFSHYSL